MTTKTSARAVSQPKARTTRVKRTAQPRSAKPVKLKLVTQEFDGRLQKEQRPRPNPQTDSRDSMLLRPQSHLSLYSGTPKIVVDPADDAISRLPIPAGIELVPLTVADGWIAASGTRVNSRPTFVLGFAAASQAAAERLSSVREVWMKAFGESAPELFRHDDPDSQTGGLLWIVTKLLALLRKSSERNVVQTRDLTALRVAHEHTQEAFRRLESLLSATAALDRSESFVMEPQRHHLPLQPSQVLTQMVPGSSVGVSDIAVHIARAGASGRLHARLHAVEQAEVVGSWIVDAEDLPTGGWLHFGLAEALGPDEQTLRLELGNEDIDDLRLSLSVPHPEHRWCATVATLSFERPLALKLWRSLPQTRPHMLPGAVASGQARRGWLVGIDALRNPTVVRGPVDHVSYVEDTRGLLVHPIDSNPTVALLPNVCPSGTAHVSASIQTRHAEAGSVEYALGIVTRKRKPKKRADAEPDVISEWVSVPAMQKSEVHLFLPEPLEDSGDLQLLTRIAGGGNNWFCWATFSSIRAFPLEEQQ